MRLFVHIFLLCSYLASSTGIGLRQHYCMGKLSSISIVMQSSTERCNKCGIAKKASRACCEDEVAFSKLNQPHAQHPAGSLPHQLAVAPLAMQLCPATEALHTVSRCLVPVVPRVPHRPGVDVQSFLQSFRC
jgi:hypothetical protein